MLQKLVQELRGDTIVARDGEIGSLSDAYFDDERWTLRYLVIDTGRWLPGRKVLVSPKSVAEARGSVMRLDLLRDEVEHAPGIDADPPVSLLLREAHERKYGYPYGGPFIWGAVPLAAPPAPDARREDAAQREAARQAESRAARSHLRSASEVVGCRIRALDGEIGHVEDFVVDDESWAIADMVVDTRNWLPGKKVLVPPSAIDGIDWEQATVSVRLRREELKHSPKAD
jgi:hypothetical protein